MLEYFQKKKKEKEFTNIVEKYTPYVAKIVYNIVGQYLTKEDIEEIICSVFISIWEQNVDLKKDNLKSYIAGISRNISLNYLRKFKDFSELDEDYISSSSDVSQDFEQKELSTIINQLVNDMNETDKSIFIKYYWFCQDTKKIAEDLDLNRSTVMSKLSRCREKLKKKLIERGYGYEKV